MTDNLTGYTPEDEQLVAAHVAAFVEYHFEEMHMQESMGSLLIMRVLQNIWQTSKENPTAIVNPAYLKTIETALQRWSMQHIDFKPLFDKNPDGAILLCVATFFRFYDELLDGITAMLQAGNALQDSFREMLKNIPDDIHTVSDTTHNRAKTGRRTKNQQHNRKQ